MNDKLLLHHKVNIPVQDKYIKFLNFIHPNYKIVNDLHECDNYDIKGIIYTGKVDNDTIFTIKKFTDNWIIVSNKDYDIDLSTNEGLVKNLLPLQFFKIKKSLKKDTTPVYNTVSYDSLLEQIKISLLLNSSLEYESTTDESVYNLYRSILCTPDVLTSTYFNLVNKYNINLITSSILTFLSKVQSKNTVGASQNYTRLLIQSNNKYGKKIKQGIVKFIHSKSNKIISLYNLLSYLNRG